GGEDVSSPVNLSDYLAGDFTFRYTVAPFDPDSDCESDYTDVVIIIFPNPEPPAYQITQADCLGGNGSLAFVNPGEDLYYSIDGGSFVLYEDEIILGVDTYQFRIRYGLD